MAMDAPPYFIKAVRSHLPLTITRAVLDENGLLIGGDGWVFATESAWRFASQRGFEFGSGSEVAPAQIDSLVGQSITVAYPFGTASLDPSFVLSGGMIFEHFSTTDFEPWELRLPGNVTIIADGTGA
jgi:hypothetical protein